MSFQVSVHVLPLGKKKQEYISPHLTPSSKFNFMETFNINKTFTKYIHINNSSQIHSLMVFHRWNSCLPSTQIKRQSLNHALESMCKPFLITVSTHRRTTDLQHHRLTFTLLELYVNEFAKPALFLPSFIIFVRLTQF